jgi:phytoene synthase
VVPPARKLALLSPILGAVRGTPTGQPIPPLAETRFLLDAIGREPLPQVPASGIEDRLVWVLELFERLERRDRDRRTPAYARRTEMSAALGGLASPAAFVD